MRTMISYPGVVEGGKVRLIDAALPDGTEVVVVAVAQPLPSVEEQIQRLQAIPPEEWRKPFEAAIRAWDESEPAELEGQPLSDSELSALIEEAREEVYAKRRRRPD